MQGEDFAERCIQTTVKHGGGGTFPLHPGVRGACTPWRTHPMRDEYLLPTLFVLLRNKTEATYRRMWEQIRTLCSLAQPRDMLLDFEKAAINSFVEVWPDALIRCCFFPLTQNLWRKVQAAGMQADYNHDKELAMRIRQLPALAFASPSDVQHLFAAVVQQLPMPQAPS